MTGPLVEITTSGSDNFWLVGSTLLGAIVGGFASAVGAWLIARDTARRDEKTQTRTSALQLVVKAKLLADSAYSIHRQIEETIGEAEAAGLEGPTWTKLTGILHNDAPAIFLDHNQISLLLQMKNDGLTNEFILLTHRVRSLETSLGEYERRRTKLTENFEANSMNGRVGSSLFTEAEMAALAPRMVEVGVLADDIRKRALDEHIATVRLVHTLGPILKSHLADSNFPVGHIPDELLPLVEEPVAQSKAI